MTKIVEFTSFDSTFREYRPHMVLVENILWVEPITERQRKHIYNQEVKSIVYFGGTDWSYVCEDIDTVVAKIKEAAL